MLRPMRGSIWVLAALLACHPSASIERTMPVANLQTYHTVALRVQSTAFGAQGLAAFMENSQLAQLKRVCGFESVARAGATPADLVLDLNITQTGRGGGGFITNDNVATIDTLLVLTDGQSGEILGSARIKGKSSGVIYNGGMPEQEAIDAVAKSIANLLGKSGCSGPRIARVVTPPPNAGSDGGATTNDGSGATHEGSGAGSAGTSAPDSEQAKQAEALNDQGKDKFRAADVSGALALFQQAVALSPDARFQYNVCLALEAAQRWDDATNACKQAKTMGPKPELVAKIDHRLDLLAHHQ
jgi:hypothetical protein